MNNFVEIPVVEQKVIDKFWSKVTGMENENSCWTWTGSVRSNDKPYGRMVIDKKHHGCHRLSYYFKYGINPLSFDVLHTCDNPRCVNPTHLKLGTNSDNVADKVRKGRQARNVAWNKGQDGLKGMKNASSKLTDETVRKIRAEYKFGENGAYVLAKEYGVSKPLIYNIVKRKSWKHI